MTAPRLTLIDGGPTDGLASSRSGGVGGLRPPAPTPWREGIGPRCPQCQRRELVRLAQYDPAIPANSYGCRSCKEVALLSVDALFRVGAFMVLIEPDLSEQLALTLAVKGIPPRGAK